jgi:EAL domain-containing protein (putative c-di-GMP-specific phosphodiesterase class I)
MAAMVSSINHIGHVLGLKTTAEFVENEKIRGALQGMGVDYVQGYGVSKPFPFKDLQQG